MANTTISDGAQLLFADHSGDFSSGAPNTAANSLIIGTPVDVQMDPVSLAASGGGHQSAKTVSLGALRSTLYELGACIEFAVAPTDGSVDFYWGKSRSGTAGTGNPGELTGADGGYTETDELLDQLRFIGSMKADDTLAKKTDVGVVKPTQEYGILVIINNCNQAFAATMDEFHVTLTPIITGAS